MPREFYSASEAAQTLGISLDTLRRWDRQGRIKTKRDSSNRRIVTAKEIDRLRGGAHAEHQMSARNRFSGIVRDVRVEGLMAQVEMVVTEPATEPGPASDPSPPVRDVASLGPVRSAHRHDGGLQVCMHASPSSGPVRR